MMNDETTVVSGTEPAADAPAYVPPAPTGWTREQLDVLSPALADAVERLVRECNGFGVRLRPVDGLSAANTAVVQMLDEAGQRLSLTSFHAVTLPKLVQPFGLLALLDPETSAVALKLGGGEAAATEAPDADQGAASRRPRARGGR